jgi:RNA polymerase sigma factor (sigma-70 family)
VRWSRALGLSHGLSRGLSRAALGQTLSFTSVGGGGAGMTWPPAQPFALVLDRARALDSAAVGQLYSRFLPVVYRFVLARVSDVHIAEDLTSDTFFAMVEQIGSTRAQDELSFAAWLLGIARNKVLMHYRRRKTGPTFAPELDDEAHPTAYAEEDDPLAIITAKESWSEVVVALNQLTEEQRTVVLYRCVLGYSTDEVAQLMEKKPGTIRALQFRALASLARLLNLAEVQAMRSQAMRSQAMRSQDRRSTR